MKTLKYFYILLLKIYYIYVSGKMVNSALYGMPKMNRKIIKCIL